MMVEKGKVRRIATKPPLGLLLGSVVQFSAIDFALAADDLCFKLPSPELIVNGIGKISWDDTTLWRVYFEGEADLFLQVGSEADLLTVTECRLFRKMDELHPGDADEWSQWLGPEGNIGYEVFPVQQEGWERDYYRMWGGDGTTQVEPFSFVERVSLDHGGNKTQQLEHTAVLYGVQLREEPALNEYLLPSVLNETSVNLWLGTDIAVEGLTIHTPS